MPEIEIDQEVLEALGAKAKPFVDTPNSVLRRLLGLDVQSNGQPSETRGTRASSSRSPNHSGGETMSSTTLLTATSSGGVNRLSFVQKVLREEFGGTFRVRSPYQMMFESDTHLVYFQNFNASGSHNFWYRLNERPFQILRSSPKQAFVCLTVPPEGSVFVLPVREIAAAAARAEWSRSELEVNIDPTTLRWRELNWDLTSYRRVYTV